MTGRLLPRWGVARYGSRARLLANSGNFPEISDTLSAPEHTAVGISGSRPLWGQFDENGQLGFGKGEPFPRQHNTETRQQLFCKMSPKPRVLSHLEKKKK